MFPLHSFSANRDEKFRSLERLAGDTQSTAVRLDDFLHQV